MLVHRYGLNGVDTVREKRDIRNPGFLKNLTARDREKIALSVRVSSGPRPFVKDLVVSHEHFCALRVYDPCRRGGRDARHRRPGEDDPHPRAHDRDDQQADAHPEEAHPETRPRAD